MSSNTSEPSAKVIADSISPDGHRLTTMEVVMHRFVLAEFNTHRVFSRNSASSRAIPVVKQLERVRRDPAIPLSWPAEQRGMQGGDEVTGDALWVAENNWRRAGEDAASWAEGMANYGVHKSVTNRLLEPFMWHTVVVTATAWENFFALRCNPMAQPEIRASAEAMKAAYDASRPDFVPEGEWHLPYVTDIECEIHSNDELVKVSSARVARTSYLTHDGVADVGKDIGLYERLTSADPMHASPLEQVARPAPDNEHEVEVKDEYGNVISNLVLPRYGNLLGWHQHRFDVEAERGYSAYA